MSLGLELRRPVRGPGRPAAGRTRPASRWAVDDVGRVRPARRRHGGNVAGRRRRRAGQGGPVPLQRAGVPRVRRSPPSRRGWPPSTRTTATPPTSSSTSGTTPTSSPSSSTAAFAERIEELRARLPRIHTWLWVDDGSGPRPDWAVDYEAAATSSPAQRIVAPWGRYGDHLLLLYTGGTTGQPKGVMWRQDDLFGALDAANRKRLPPEQDLVAAAARVAKPGPRNLPAAPLMHGTGLFNALSNLMIGGSVITMEGRRFDPVELLDTVEPSASTRCRSSATPSPSRSCRALDAQPERWDISSLRVIVSSGVMWSAETKAGLLRHNGRLIMVDALGSSEAIGMASSTVTADGSAPTASFQLGPDARVVTEDGRDVVPGSGELGLVAMRGHTPVGYYKDPGEVGGDVPASSTACATRSPATSPPSTSTAPCGCWGAAASASTPAARRCTRRRSRRCSSCTRASSTRPWSGCRTSASARP